MIIVLFGKPGAGKGTQAPMLAEQLGVRTLATGDVLRAAVREGTPRGLEAKAYMDRGDLVPDEVILAIVKEALAKPEYASGAILDGVVRTVPQAEGLASVLKQIGRKAKENFEERGLETLHLAAGLATWKGEDGKRPPESACQRLQKFRAVIGLTSHRDNGGSGRVTLPN